MFFHPCSCFPVHSPYLLFLLYLAQCKNQSTSWLTLLAVERYARCLKNQAEQLPSIISLPFVVIVQPVSCIWLFVTPMDCSMPGSSVLHYLPEFVQIHVHWVGDAIQPSYPLLAPSPPALSLSQHQVLFQWVSSSHQVAKVLELQL